ncbi:hypothetical protein RHGRI_026041 [Rhododendron griersonianum]|uniref:RING-type domain-containing protein n=1 Tax=Rhododendron griersonianum TaxID=479676 RepID=A0AAV6IWF1_9ERIC|nr:hypothetical protein RHGRI_026041 [Rhododendron griersonianum]
MDFLCFHGRCRCGTCRERLPRFSLSQPGQSQRRSQDRRTLSLSLSPMENQQETPAGVETDEEFPDEFQCCVCWDILFKPVVLVCGHISCFWCVYKMMNQQVSVSHCPVCRHPYNHFPSICQLLHFVLLKLYPQAYKRREQQVLEEEKRKELFSPQLDNCFRSEPSKGLRICSHLPPHSTTCSCNKPNIEGTEKVPPQQDSMLGGILSRQKNSLQLLITDFHCAACKELLYRPVVLNCGHVYCEVCIISPTDRVPRCQVCQSAHPNGCPKVCLLLKNFLEEQFSEQYALRKENVQEHADSQNRSPSACSIQSLNNAPMLPSISTYPYQSWLSGRGPKVHNRAGCDYCGISVAFWFDFGCRDLLVVTDCETLPTAANAYSRLSRSFLGQFSNVPRSVAPILESSTLVSRNGGPGSYRGPVRSGGRGESRNVHGSGANGGFGRGDSRSFRGNGSFRGGGHTGGRGDRKYTLCHATNHTEPYCWKKYGKLDYVHQVSDSAPPSHSQLSTASTGYFPRSNSHDALTTQVSELVQTLRLSLPATSSTATLANSAANAYSRLSRSFLGQFSNVPRSVAPIPESSTLVSRNGGPGSYRGPVRSGGRGESRNVHGSGANGGFGRGDSRSFHGNGSFCGGGHTGGRGDRKYTLCHATNHTEPYCWKKYGKLDYVHQVSDSAPPSHSQLSTASTGYFPRSNSHDALTTQVSELVQTLRLSLPATSSTATLANSGNVACAALTSPSWILDSGASTHMSGNSSLFSDMHPINHHIVLADGSSQPVLGKANDVSRLETDDYESNSPDDIGFSHFARVLEEDSASHMSSDDTSENEDAHSSI